MDNIINISKQIAFNNKNFYVTSFDVLCATILFRAITIASQNKRFNINKIDIATANKEIIQNKKIIKFIPRHIKKKIIIRLLKITKIQNTIKNNQQLNPVESIEEKNCYFSFCEKPAIVKCNLCEYDFCDYHVANHIDKQACCFSFCDDIFYATCRKCEHDFCKYHYEYHYDVLSDTPDIQICKWYQCDKPASDIGYCPAHHEKLKINKKK